MRIVLELLYGLSFLVTLFFFIKSLSKRDEKARYIQLILLMSALMILIYCLTLFNESSALARCNYMIAAVVSDWIFWYILQYLYVGFELEKNFNHAVFVIIILDPLNIRWRTLLKKRKHVHIRTTIAKNEYPFITQSG